MMKITVKKRKYKTGTIQGVLNDGSGADDLKSDMIVVNTELQLQPISDEEHAAKDKHIKAHTNKHK